ncbi:MAG: DUF4013 domain-containing protein [Gemmataceae bacterium]
MRYLRSYQFVFDSPKWHLNLLFGAVCQLIPVIGPIVFMGYMYQMIAVLHQRRTDQEYPDFDFNRFMPYLTRGVWPFLMSLIVLFPLGFLLGIVYAILGFTAAAMTGPAGASDGEGAILLLGFLCFYVFLLAVIFAVSIALIPMMIRAGFSQELAFGASWQFAKDFLARVWKEMVLALLFVWATSLVVIFAGMLLCCIGIYPAAALIAYASHHLYYQLYELYLERGGTLIPYKEDAPTTA